MDKTLKQLTAKDYLGNTHLPGYASFTYSNTSPPTPLTHSPFETVSQYSHTTLEFRILLLQPLKCSGMGSTPGSTFFFLIWRVVEGEGPLWQNWLSPTCVLLTEPKAIDDDS